MNLKLQDTDLTLLTTALTIARQTWLHDSEKMRSFGQTGLAQEFLNYAQRIDQIREQLEL